MKFKKPILVAGTAVTVGLAGLAGSGVVSAATNTQEGDSLVDKIATTFNLDKSEVQDVFEEHREGRQAEHQQNIEEELSQLVENGELTEAQKQSILDKRAELQAAREEAINNEDGEKDKEQMKEEMEQQREELKTWAEENDIDEQYLHFVFGMGQHHGLGHGDQPRPLDN